MRLWAALLVAGCGAAPGTIESADRAARIDVRLPSFAALDANEDGHLDEVELVRAALPYHEAWDLDENGLVVPSELARGLFGMLDRDGDDRITADELTAHARIVLPPGARTIADWDQNADGVIDRRELREGLEGVFPLLDADEDGAITDLELTTALLGHLDANEDGVVDVEEWRVVARG